MSDETNLNISVHPEKDEKVVALSLSLAHVGHKEDTPGSRRCAPRKPQAGLRAEGNQKLHFTQKYYSVTLTKCILLVSAQGFQRGPGSLQFLPALLPLVDPLKSIKIVNCFWLLSSTPQN